MKRLDLTKAGVHPDLVAKMREWESIPAAERIALEVAPLCPHGTADPAVCPDCLTPAEQRIDPLDLMRIPPEFRDARMSDLPKLLLDKLGPYLASWPPASGRARRIVARKPDAVLSAGWPLSWSMPRKAVSI